MKIRNSKQGLIVLVAITIVGAIGIWLAGSNTGPRSCAGAATSYKGLSESQAIAKAKKEHYSYRVAARDGQGFILTADFVPQRLNFEINNGIIVKANCG